MTPASGNERIWWLILIILVVGYLAGTWINRQRALKLGKWLQVGLGIWNGKPSWRVVRSINSGAEVTVTDTGHPFKWVQIGIYLLTREFPPLWGFELLRNKRDRLAMSAQLRATPGIEWEIMPLQGKLRRLLDRGAGEALWQWEELPSGLGLATRAAPPAELVKRARTFAEKNGVYVERLALRQRITPHLLVFVQLRGLEREPAGQFLRSINELVRE